MLHSVLKYNPYHDPKTGKFTSANRGAAGSGELGPLDRRLIDYKPDRSLSDPSLVTRLDALLPEVEFRAYSKVPFFQKVNELQGTPNPQDIDISSYVKARDTLFYSQPIEQVPLDSVVVTQPHVNKARVKQIRDDPSTGGTKPIHAVRYAGKTYILNGHHRIAAEILNRQSTTLAHVLHMVDKMEFQTILKYNKCHDPKTGRFCSGGGGKLSQPVFGFGPDFDAAVYAADSQHPITEVAIVRQLSVAEQRAFMQVKELYSKSLTEEISTHKDPRYVNPDGTWKPERAALHEKIMSDYLSDRALKAAKPKAGEQPTLIMLGGRGGSGKSAFTNGNLKEFSTEGFLKVDNDEIKAMLPGYKGYDAWAFHEEASLIGDAIVEKAREYGLNVVVDATMKTTSSAEKRVKKFQESGYKIEGHYMFLPVAESQTSVVKRAAQLYLEGKDPRYVPVELVAENTTNETTFQALRKYFSNWSFYSRKGGGNPKLVAHA